MAISGVLTADFSQFVSEGQRAQATLKGMEGGAARVQSSLSTMSTGAVGANNSLRDSFGQVDQALAASGVQVGKYARGLVEISEMAGKTAGEIGLLASGASVFAAAMAGYQFGTWIAGFTGLNEWILKTVDSFTGLGAVASGAAGDAMVLATQRAEREITSLSEAIQINTQWQKEHSAQLELTNAQYRVSADRLAEAQKFVRGLSEATIKEIEVSKQAGATNADLLLVYGTSALALKVLADRKSLAAEMSDKHTAAMKKEAAAAQAYDVEIANQIVLFDNLARAAQASQDLKVSNKAAAGWITEQVAIKRGIDEQAAATKAYLTEQDALTAATDALSQAHTTAGAAAVSATSAAAVGYAGVAQQVTMTGEAMKVYLELMRMTNQANAINKRNSLFQTTSQAEALAGLGGPSLNNTAGAFKGGGGGASVNNVFNIVDTEANIAKRVSDHITQSVMRAVPV